jgi:hypothetical protein
MLDRIGRNRRLSLVAIGATSVALLVSGGVWAARYRAAHRVATVKEIASTGGATRQQEATPTARGLATGGPPSNTPKGAQTLPPTRPTSAGDSHPRPATAGPSRPHAPAARDVAISVVQKNYEILVDGVSTGQWDPTKKTIRVPPGAHKIVFRSVPHYFDKPFDLAADATSLPQVKLEYRPATLEVNTVPDDAEVTFQPKHGVKMRMHGHSASVHIPATSNGREMVHVVVVASEHVTREEDVEVTAGTPTSKTIELQKLP